MLNRRQFLSDAAFAAAGAVSGCAAQAERGSEAARRLPQVRIRDVQVVRVRERGKKDTALYLEIAADGGLAGHAGPLLAEQAKAVSAGLRELLVGRDALEPRALNSETLWEALHPGKFKDYAAGRDPLTGQAIWGTRRQGRHTPTGAVIMAASAADNALWDLRGKARGVPVYRLLEGSRDRVPAYASMLGFSVEPAEARKTARDFFDRGFTAQKWFFGHGPSDGDAGRRNNLDLVRTLREELGPDARLMFDAIWKNWDVPYAVSMARDMLPYKPFWLEEPLYPEDIEGYARIKGETGIPLASGEHFYTRWNLRPFLDRKILSVVQTDPEWCGGISELARICGLVRTCENVLVVPHGHHVLAAAHAVASQPESLCPMVEFLFHRHARAIQRFQKRIVQPEGGYLEMPAEPGLGPPLDESRIERV